MKKTVKAIIQYKDLYFLQLRDNNNKIPYPNCWSFFGGRLLLKENPTTGLVRELLEELNFNPLSPIEFYRWYNQETKSHIIFYKIILLHKKKFEFINEGQKGSWFRKIDLNKIHLGPDVNAVKKLL